MPRGRPRQFDPDAVRDAVLDTFWRRGVGAVALSDLTEASGLHRPSLAAAFGDKDDLLAVAVDRYVERQGAWMLEPLAEPKLKTALKGLYARVIAVATEPAGPGGCLISCVLPAAAETSPRAKAKLAESVALIDAMLTRRFAQATAEERPPGMSAEMLGQLALGQMMGIAVRARSGAAPSDLEGIAAAAVTLLTSA